MRTSGLLILAIFIYGCGGDAPIIADKVRFRVNFTQQTVQISFILNSKYAVAVTKQIAFKTLGEVTVSYVDNPQTQNEVSARLSADPLLESTPWPSRPIKSFPNGNNLPASVPASQILRWAQESTPMDIALLYTYEPKLVVGGAILSDQFSSAPKNLLATQEFKAANGDVEATMSFAGPTDKTKGGIYFFGNFGVKPFDPTAALARTNPKMDESLQSGDREVMWELLADKPAEIINPGRSRFDFFDFARMLKTLSLQLALFQPL